MRARFFSLHLDAIGFFAAALCALHCALLPFLLLVLPHTPLKILNEPLAEAFLVLGSFVVSLASLSASYFRHRRKRVLLLMLAGFGIILFGLAAAPTKGVEILTASGGALLVAAAHYLNWCFSHKH